MSRFSVALVLTASWLAAAGGADWPQFRGPAAEGVSTETGPAHDLVGNRKRRLENAAARSGIVQPDLRRRPHFSHRLQRLQRARPGGRRHERPGAARASVSTARPARSSGRRQVPSKLPEQERIRDDHGYASSTPVSDGAADLRLLRQSRRSWPSTWTARVLWQAGVGDGSARLGHRRLADPARQPADRQRQRRERVARRPGQERPARKSGGPAASRRRGTRPDRATRPPARRSCSWPSPASVLGLDPASGQATLVLRLRHPSLHGAQPRGRWRRRLLRRRPAQRRPRGQARRQRRRDRRRIACGRPPKARSFRRRSCTTGISTGPTRLSGILYCAELATGKIVYEERLKRAGQFYASPVLADGKIYYLTRNGRPSSWLPSRSSSCWPPTTWASGRRSTPAPSSPTAGCSCGRTRRCIAWTARSVKIVSLLPGATEMLFALGLGEQVHAVGHECDFPPEVSQLPRATRVVGSTRRSPAARSTTRSAS